MGPAAVGTYNKADSLVNIPFGTISGSLYEALFRGLSTVQGDLTESKRLYLRSIEMLAVYTLPLYLGMAWLAEPFILGVYGPKWSEAITPLSILALSGVFTCIGHPAGAVLAAQNMLGRELVVQITFLGTTLAGILIGMHWGVAGIAVSIVAARGVSALQITRLVATRLPNRCAGRACNFAVERGALRVHVGRFTFHEVRGVQAFALGFAIARVGPRFTGGRYCLRCRVLDASDRLDRR